MIKKLLTLFYIYGFLVASSAGAISADDDIMAYEKKLNKEHGRLNKTSNASKVTAGAGSNDDVAEVVEEEINDPIEPFNRAVFEFNDGLDRAVIKPIAQGYNFMVPSWWRHRIGYAFTNLWSPVTFANQVLQGRVGYASVTLWRFIINSTLGIAGTFDVASKIGLEYEKQDFGKTLGYWGMDYGYYVVIPILGPSSTRDTAGRLTDLLFDPVNYMADYPVILAKNGLLIVHTRSENLDFTSDIERVSIDQYATIRSLYLQNRASQVKSIKK